MDIIQEKAIQKHLLAPTCVGLHHISIITGAMPPRFISAQNNIPVHLKSPEVRYGHAVVWEV